MTPVASSDYNELQYIVWEMFKECSHPFYWEVVYKGHTVDFGYSWRSNEAVQKAAESLFSAIRLRSKDGRIGWKKMVRFFGREPRGWMVRK